MYLTFIYFSNKSETSLFERMGGTCTPGTDGMYYPDVVRTDEEPHYGKYGRMRRQYLKEHRPAEYYAYLLEKLMTAHLNNETQSQKRKLLMYIMKLEIEVMKSNIPVLIDFGHPGADHIE